MKKRVFFAPYVCVLLYCIFAALASKISLLAFICPLFIMLFGAFSLFKNSKITLGLGSIILIAATLFINKDFVFSLVYCAGYIAAGFLLCYSLLRRKGGTYALLTTLVCVLISEYGAVALSNVISGKPALIFIDEMFENIKPLVINTLTANAETLNIGDPESIFSVYVMAVKMMLPSVMTIIVLFDTIILCFFVKVIVNKVLKGVAVDLRFSMFKADGVTIFVFLISALVSMFAGDGVIAVVFGNIYVILSVALMLCGMSLLDWYLRDVQKVKIFFRFLLLLVIIVSSLFPILPVVLIVAALIDSRRNFRSIGNDTEGKQN